MSGAEIAVVLGASLLGAFVKSVTGLGYPVIAVPIIALVLGIEDAVVIVAIPSVTLNAAMCLATREGRHEARDLGRLAGFGFVGAFFGTFLLVNVPEEPLLLGLAATIALFVGQYLRAPNLRIDPEASRRWAPPVGVLAGVSQGAVGVSGPIVAMWLHGYRLPAQAYVFSVTAIFGVSGAVQLSLLASAGEITGRRLSVSLLAFVPVLAMLPIGRRVRDRLAGPGFERAVLGVLVLSGAGLVLQALG